MRRLAEVKSEGEKKEKFKLYKEGLWLSKMKSRMFVAALRLVLTTPTD